MNVKKRTRPTITLDTNDDTRQLIFKHIEAFGVAGCRCRIIVNSSGFMCDRPFEFDNGEQFLKSLRSMHDTLQGEARLSYAYEDSFVALKADHLGHIYVSGQIVHYDEVDQSLEFAFITDQTCLKTLIKDFELLEQSQ